MQDEVISKTKQKQAMLELQVLGAALVELAPAHLAELPLDEPLLAAILEAKRITSHEARRRQMQYLGKLMRFVDEEPIRAKLDEWNNVTRVQAAKFHLLERWRERLITDEKALSELVMEYARADIQQIRTLIRNAQKEAATGKPPKSSRALFKLLREMILEEKDAEPEQND